MTNISGGWLPTKNYGCPTEPLKEEPSFLLLSRLGECVLKRVASCPVFQHTVHGMVVVGSSSRMQGALSAPQRAYPTMRACLLQQSTHHKDGASGTTASLDHSLLSAIMYSNLAGFYVLGPDKWDRPCPLNRSLKQTVTIITTRATYISTCMWWVDRYVQAGTVPVDDNSKRVQVGKVYTTGASGWFRDPT